jgi:bacteriorhodopsin
MFLSNINSLELFKKTLWFSLYVQIVTGIINFLVLFIKIPIESYILKELLVLELIVQIIESAFYVWLVYNYKDITNVTIHRYVDWFFTTPTMLITLIAYLIYLDYSENEGKTPIPRLMNILHDNQDTVLWILGLNALMLFFGALGELNYLYPFLSFSLGFIPFFIYFKTIYENYAIRTERGQQIFGLFFIVWTLYGVASFFPYLWKNISYNLLDIFSKNIFGFYLSYLVVLSSFS